MSTYQEKKSDRPEGGITERGTVVTQEATTCPGCQEQVFADERFCPDCGFNLERAQAAERVPTPSRAGDTPPASPAPPAPPAPTGAPSGCAHCATGEVGAGGYCEHCGHAQPRPRDHMEQQLDGVAAVTDRGYRHHRNEDAFALGDARTPGGTPVSFAVVCDGVSSASRPDEASEAASYAARDHLRDALSDGVPAREAMHDAVLAAARAVEALERPDGSRNAPACTFVAGIVTGADVVLGWIGDSRVYWIPHDRQQPRLLTEDDSWAAEMVARGLLSKEEALADPRAHAITGWLGSDNESPRPHTAQLRQDRDGELLVCSDGLWNYAEESSEIAGHTPVSVPQEPLAAARQLVRFALHSGGHDNVTVAVVPLRTEQGVSADAEPDDDDTQARESAAKESYTPTLPDVNGPRAADAPLPQPEPQPETRPEAPSETPSGSQPEPDSWPIQQPGQQAQPNRADRGRENGAPAVPRRPANPPDPPG